MTRVGLAARRWPAAAARVRTRALRPGSFARGVLEVAGGTLAGQALLLAATPLLTRLYTPAEFGVLAVFAALLFVVVPVASLRYDIAVSVADDDETAMNLLALSAAVLAGATLLSAAAVALFGDGIARVLAGAAVRPYLWALPLAVGGAGAYQALNGWAVRKKRYPAIGRTRVTQSVGQVATQLGAGLLGMGAGGLVAGDVVGRVGGAGPLAAPLWREDRPLLRAVSWARMREAAGLHRRFPLLSSWSALVNAVGLNLPALVFGALFGAATAGLFVLAQRVVGMPLRLVGNSVAQVYLGEAGRLAREDPAAARALFMRTARRLLLVGLAPTVVIAALGALLFRLAFGVEWQQAGVYAQVLALPFALQAVADPLSQTLNVNQRQDLQLGWDAARLVLAWGAVYAAARLGYGALAAIAAYAAVLAVMYVVLFAMSLWSFRRPGPGAAPPPVPL